MATEEKTGSKPLTSTGEARAMESTVVYDGLSVNLLVAPIGKRIVAYCIDMGVVSLILYAVMIALMFLFVGTIAIEKQLKGIASEYPIAAIVLVIILIFAAFSVFALIFHGYFVFFEHKKGTTPGKKVFGLRVISLKGSRLTFGQCVLRDMMRYLDCMMVFPGLISMCATKRRQRLGDMLASTLVVYSPKKEIRPGYLYLTATEFDWMRESLQPKSVAAQLARDYLKFAYAEFVLFRQGGDVASYSQWEATAREHFAQDSKAFQQRELLLFFAEWCSQSLNPRR